MYEEFSKTKIHCIINGRSLQR